MSAAWRHRRRWTRCGCGLGEHDRDCPRAALAEALAADPLPAVIAVEQIPRLRHDTVFAARALAAYRAELETAA